MLIFDGIIIYEKKNRYKFLLQITATFALAFAAILIAPTILNGKNYFERLLQFPYPLALFGIYFISLFGNIGIKKIPEAYLDVTENGILLSIVGVYADLKEQNSLSDAVMLHNFELIQPQMKNCVYYKEKGFLKISSVCYKHYKTPMKNDKAEYRIKFEVEKNVFFKGVFKMNPEEWETFKEKTSGHIDCTEFLKKGEVS